MNTRKEINELVFKINAPKLSKEESKKAYAYYKAKGYKLHTTNWHRYFKTINGVFNVKYIPDDIFKAVICPKFNQSKQWPALVDKNITYKLFNEFNQPIRVIQNINGFYYHNDKIISRDAAIKIVKRLNKPMIIKPTIETGQGNMVKVFTLNDNKTSINNLSVIDLLKLYVKDFIIQELVDQSPIMKQLNPSSLNTLRVMTYIRQDKVHVLSTVARIGNPDSVTDNFSAGGIIVGVKSDGKFKEIGYTKYGKVYNQTHTGVVLKGLSIPNYNRVIEMAKNMHIKVPYFKFISWDIGLDKSNEPIFIEYNTYNQSSIIHQITNGPLFGEFTNEILALALKSN
ncbi:sugar-transfer associated ATP-grasp domain-containing protein [Ichthyenterobacterium sp. W332]|uniref:Sugar-transfer associated ATP-grasp domain-containing protein n=1 Tax=Microcosmobacter mediterraneus TaxID=3075607 RepID=A0ABU2YKP0_9FLAO|nr:sugar-transfer associated ATP-grasp domain-containing protein [Ichthyenterobacterium sp. W332]MDT0558740.1 sugar-transfer associated ATP-grasp domain-containing protein [Ichthyenterobacterium sp. W332]